MDHSHDPNGIVTDFVDKTVVFVGENFSCVWDRSRPARKRKLSQPTCRDAQRLVYPQSCARIVGSDKFPYLSAVILRVG